MLNLLVIVLLSYLVGAIPTGIIMTKAVRGIDIREHGSGNMGGTNVMRILGWKYGLAVILLDALKGALAVIVIARLYLGSFPFPNQTPFDDFTLVQIIAGTSAVIGHIWTIFAEFKGGKGIATGMGIVLALTHVDILLAIGIFIVIVAVSRYVSLGSIIATISIPVILVIRENVFHVQVTGYGTLLPFLIALAFLIVFTHRKNIKRLLAGNESKISFKKHS
jgi:glycerol-3-phosphate acyltransferase PlsY